jgi:hypothetical protein
VIGNRRLSDDTRAKVADLCENPELGDGRSLVLAVFKETELRDCEQRVGLHKPTPEFREAIAEAVLFACLLHRAKPKRASIVRGELKLVERKAAAAAMSLQQLSEALDQTMIRDLFPETIASLTAASTLNSLRGLEVISRDAASRFNDETGRSPLVAFGSFIRLLADAFGRAAGRPAGLTWNEHHGRWEGRFWGLVGYVLPRAKMLAGDRFAPASDIALGRYIQHILTTMDKTTAPVP